MSEFRASKCFGCKLCRYGGTANVENTRCLHPEGAAESHALGSRLSGEDTTGPLALKLNVLATLKGFNFPEAFDPLAIDDCQGFDAIMQRKTRNRV